MQSHQTLCACGYDRFGLTDEERCPECGEIQIIAPPVGRIRSAWQGNPSPTAITSFILSLVTLVLSVLVTGVILVMVVMLSNQSGGFGAPIGLILPAMGYLFIVMPAAGITGVIAIIPTKGRHWPLAVYSLVFVVVSAVMPVLTFFVGLLFI